MMLEIFSSQIACILDEMVEEFYSTSEQQYNKTRILEAIRREREKERVRVRNEDLRYIINLKYKIAFNKC